MTVDALVWCWMLMPSGFTQQSVMAYGWLMTRGWLMAYGWLMRINNCHNCRRPCGWFLADFRGTGTGFSATKRVIATHGPLGGAFPGDQSRSVDELGPRFAHVGTGKAIVWNNFCGRSGFAGRLIMMATTGYAGWSWWFVPSFQWEPWDVGPRRKVWDSWTNHFPRQ